MSAIERLRQARNAEQLASEIEPLAQALAALADETRQTLSELQQASHAQAETWSQQQQKAAAALHEAASSLEGAARSLRAQAEAATEASDRLTWRLWAGAALIGSVAAAATSAFWLWLAPPSTPTVQNLLDAHALAEYLKPALVEALRPTKRPK
jgi:hypothetical protein